MKRQDNLENKGEQISSFRLSEMLEEAQLPIKKKDRINRISTLAIAIMISFVFGIFVQKAMHPEHKERSETIEKRIAYQTVNLMPFNTEDYFPNKNQLQKVIKQNKVSTIIQVGCFKGKSTMFMASIIPENGKVYAVDTWSGQPTQVFKYDPQVLKTLYDQFLSNVIHTNLTNKIVPVRMTSQEAARTLNVFPHMIYIDATHNYQQEDINLWYPFVQGHGILCGDDFSWGDGGVGKAVQEFAKLKNLEYYTDGTFWKLFKAEPKQQPQAISPYQTVNLMPFNGHGFFGNLAQVQKLIKQNNVATIIEVGCWMGNSTRFMASIIPKNGLVYAVDTFTGDPNQIFKYDPQVVKTLYDQFLSNVIHTNLTDKIVPVRMTSQEAAKALRVFPHMIYIDATHSYQQAINDLDLWYPFIKGHGIICGDDFNWGDGGVGRAVQEFAKQNSLEYYTDGLFWKLFEAEPKQQPQAISPYQTVNLMSFNANSSFPNLKQVQKVIKQNKVSTIIQVGCYKGKSTMFMASIIPENGKVYAVDTWSGQPTQVFKYDPQVLKTLYDQFLSNVIHTNLTNKIVPVRMTSQEAARTLNVFPHMIYIDATHDYPQGWKDINLWYPFVQGHGILCGDDFSWGDGGVGKAVQEFAKLKNLEYYTDGTFWKLFKAEPKQQPQAISPYQTVNLMPFNGHGFFGNLAQVQKLIKQNNVATIIEVGCWMGNSTRFMASIIPKNGLVYAVDTFTGDPNQIFKYDPQVVKTLYDQFLSNVIHTNLTDKIVPVRMTSQEAAKALRVFPHMIYIDATHSYQQAINDLDLWYPFIKGHGIICGDDFNWGDGGVGRAVQEFAKQNSLEYYTDGLFWKLFEAEPKQQPQAISPYQTVNLMSFNANSSFPNLKQVQKVIKQNKVSTIIQVGCYKGKSTMFMASIIPENGKVYAVDTWSGQPTQVFKYDPQVLKTLYDQFLSNVIHTNLTNKIVPVRMTSQEAARTLNVFPHMIYIDATHDYPQGWKDINLWYPFVQGHGILCGDDFSWGDGGVGKAVQEFAKLKNLEYYTDGTFWKLFKAEPKQQPQAISPYQTVNLMPFNGHGFFGNLAQVQKLIKQNNVATIIEVGCWMGNSTRFMASIIPKNGLVYAVDTFTGDPNQIFKYDPQVVKTLYDQFLSNVIHTNLTDKIVPVRMTSQEAAKALRVFPHMIYIDATHSYQQAINDLDLWYPFIKGHGIICGDDFNWGDGGVGRAVQEFAKQNNLEYYTDGLFWKLFEA